MVHKNDAAKIGKTMRLQDEMQGSKMYSHVVFYRSQFRYWFHAYIMAIEVKIMIFYSYIGGV